MIPRCCVALQADAAGVALVKKSDRNGHGILSLRDTSIIVLYTVCPVCEYATVISYEGRRLFRETIFDSTGTFSTTPSLRRRAFFPSPFKTLVSNPPGFEVSLFAFFFPGFLTTQNSWSAASASTNEMRSRNNDTHPVTTIN